MPTQWSRDGHLIVYSELARKIELWVLPMKDKAERRPVCFLASEFAVLFGQLSPDSRWMAYTSDESGQREVYVRSFPSGDKQTKVSLGGGEQARWRGDGRELFFVAPDGRMMAAAIKSVSRSGRSFVAAAPQPLFEVRLARSPSDILFEYDVTADGKRFLLDTVVDSSAPAPPLTIVLNWEESLKT